MTKLDEPITDMRGIESKVFSIETFATAPVLATGRAFGVLYVSDSGGAALLDSGLSAPRHALSLELAPRAVHAGLRVVCA